MRNCMRALGLLQTLLGSPGLHPVRIHPTRLFRWSCSHSTHCCMRAGCKEPRCVRLSCAQHAL
jgi:hypothetical protein